MGMAGEARQCSLAGYLTKAGPAVVRQMRVTKNVGDPYFLMLVNIAQAGLRHATM